MKKNSIKITRAAAYCRVPNIQSVDKMRVQEVMQNFESRNQNICFVAAYEDIGSGLETYKLPMFCQMIYDAAILKKFDMIVVQDWSRLSRNACYLIRLLRILENHGIEVCSLAGCHIPNIRSDKMMRHLIRLRRRHIYGKTVVKNDMADTAKDS